MQFPAGIGRIEAVMKGQHALIVHDADRNVMTDAVVYILTSMPSFATNYQQANSEPLTSL